MGAATEAFLELLSPLTKTIADCGKVPSEAHDEGEGGRDEVPSVEDFLRVEYFDDFRGASVLDGWELNSVGSLHVSLRMFLFL